MPAKRFRGESGYSLVEVLAAIVIMTVAILPMIAMFDTGLHSATTGSNYDKSRALANLKMEQAKNMSFDSLGDNFPEPTTYNGSGYYQSGWLEESGAASADFTNFEYRIEKQYMDQPCTDDPVADPPDPCDPSEDFVTSSSATDLIRVTVTVRWPNNNEYTTHGLVTR